MSRPRDVRLAKYVMPDGSLLGQGDETHEHIAHALGHGADEDGIERFLAASGAMRVNIAHAMFAGASAAALAGRPTKPQVAALAQLARRARTELDVSWGTEFATVASAIEVNRLFGEE